MIPKMSFTRVARLAVVALVLSGVAQLCDHQTLSFDAYLNVIEDDFLGGQRLDPATGGRHDVRENVPQLGDLMSDFDFTQVPRPALFLKPYPDNTPTPTPTVSAGS